MLVGRDPAFGGGGDSKKAKGRLEVPVCRDRVVEVEEVEQFDETEFERTREERGVEDEDAAKEEAADGEGLGRAV